MIYFIVLILLFIPVILFDFGDNQKGSKFWFYAELAILVLLAGLRFRVGGDSLDYFDFFDDYPTISELFNFDFSNASYNPLWYIYNAIIKSIWNDFIFFQIVQAIIVNSVFFWFLKKNIKYYFSAIFLYYIMFYLYFNMEILREVLAICVFLLAFGLIQKKKYLQYFIFSVIAMSFHYSAMILFIVPFFLSIPRVNVILLIIVFASSILLQTFVDISPFLTNLLFGNSMLLEKFDIYNSIENYRLNLNGVIAITTPIFIFMYIRGKSEKDELEISIEKLLLLYLILIALTIFFPAMFGRMKNYLEPFYLIYIVGIVIPTIKQNIKTNPIQILLIRFMFVWILFFNIKSYFIDCSNLMIGAKSYNIYYPYHSVFDPVTEVKREKFIEMYKYDND